MQRAAHVALACACAQSWSSRKALGIRTEELGGQTEHQRQERGHLDSALIPSTSP